MENPFNRFDKVFVISARNNQARREYINRTLTDLGIEFEFFDAVIGKDLSDSEIEAVYDENRAINHKTIKRPLSKPEIGCSLSHLNIYKNILKEDLDHALIFEDDIKPTFENFSDVNRAVKELPADWDLLYFGALNHYEKAPLSFKLKLFLYYPFICTLSPSKNDYEYRHLWNIYPRNYSKRLKFAGHHQGAHAYALSRKGAEKILAYHDKIVAPADYMLSVMCVEDELNAYITKDMMFSQNEKFESALENSRLEIRRRRL